MIELQVGEHMSEANGGDELSAIGQNGQEASLIDIVTASDIIIRYTTT